VCDLGVILDTELSFSPHVNELRSIKSSVRALPMEATKTVLNSFVVSRIDYCNSPLASAPQYQLDRLQAVMNTAARLIYGVSKFNRIQHLISDRLHWLPVHKRVQFKLCLLAYKAVHGLAPHYRTSPTCADRCPQAPSMPDGDSDPQHARTSSSPGLPRSSELAHSPSLPRLSGTDCR